MASMTAPNTVVDASPPTALSNGRKPAARAHPSSKPMEPNVHNVVLGNLLIKPWYPSFYPEELIGRTTERLYVCQWCFKYSKELMPFLGHVKVCPLKHGTPPGSLIYTRHGYSLYEVDGEEQKFYTQNLSLFAKLFLDTKSVFYDVTTFLYYILVSHSPLPNAAPGPSTTALSSSSSLAPAAAPEEPTAPQVVGFFSKEKMSWDNNNLACILVFPPWQRKGLGQVLMGVSYELSKKEERIGGPEKPLSSLGRLAYTSYWSHALARVLLSHYNSNASSKPLTVRELSSMTYILPEDIVSTLQSMQLLDLQKGEDGKTTERAYVNKARLHDWVVKHKVSMTPPVDVDGFVEKGSLNDKDMENEEEAD